MLIILILLLIVKADFNTAHEHVDLIELNHKYDCNGTLTFDQIIFYEWSPSEHRYHVRSWVISSPQIEPRKDYRSGLYRVSFTDREQKLERVITSSYFRESWTQTDPERDNKKHLDERERHALIKRLPPRPIPDDTPMIEDWSGE
jgi:hypothetical protein